MLVRVHIEVARGGLVKRRPDGSVDFISPLPCPYNYGSVVGSRAADGDPVDAIVLGPRLAVGHIGEFEVRAAIRFIDAGDIDDKLICAAGPLTAAQRRGVMLFMRTYALAKRRLNRARGRPGETVVQGWITPST